MADTLPKRYTVTSALPYANGPIHIGHAAGAYLPADFYVRYLKARGRDVVFVCGSDEHGAAITLRAKKEGKTPQEIVDTYHVKMHDALAGLGVDFDVYHRTSAPEHHKTAQDFFLKLAEKNTFEKETSEQYYDEKAQQFLADRYIKGTCPKCQHPEAYGDQCENCGSELSPTDLINPVSALTDEKPVMRSTSHWYLPMGNHEAWLKEWLNDGTFQGEQQHNPAEWKNQVLGQCRSWIDGGLHSRAMTRDLDCGVKVPLKDAEGKVLYVWLDAPIGYITNTKVWAEREGKDWEPYWKDKDTKLVHFIGKDNIVFHCIVFPILLKAHGDYILPDNVPANAFLNLEGDKISTSRNWAIWLHEYLADHEGWQDQMRYVLGSILPESRDSEFTWSDFAERVNNELVAILGNFINRAVVLIDKYYGGIIPKMGALTAEDKNTIAQMKAIPEKVAKAMEAYRFREGLQEAMAMARLGNKYLTETEPWKLQKTDPKRVETIMHITLQIAASCTSVLDPFLPFSMGKIADALGIKTGKWNENGDFLLKAGQKVTKMGVLFPKIDSAWVEAEVAKLEASKTQPEAVIEPPKENIDFETFQSLDLRVGEILTAEKVTKAKKLLQLTVDVGFEKRTVVSGIAEHFSPEEIIGKKVAVVINLAPRKIRGVESAGMILMAENSSGALCFLEVDAKANAGDVVR